MKFYDVADYIPRTDRERLGVSDLPNNMLFRPGRDGLHIMAVLTEEFRAPRKGEWFLSGAIPMAFRAPNDLPLTSEYRIMELVVVETKTTVTHHVVRKSEEFQS
jgi:hypothetical protein